MPIILATWETKIGRIVVEGLPGKTFARPNLNQWLGAVVHSCHPKLSGRLTSGELKSQASLGERKSLQGLHLNGKGPDIVACACHPSNRRSINRKIVIWKGLGKK
jgi:hypothetical protein